MKSKFIVLILAAFAVAAPAKLLAQETQPQQKSLAPYFYVKSKDSAGDELPLKETSADVQIAGVIADVTISQVYRNEGQIPLEALYIFPGSTHAAVYALDMDVGERHIVAKIKEKAAARKDYEQAKSEGKSASLLEEHRPNIFQMNVANIMPGDTIKVRLHYTEILVPEESQYEFVFPTVVGPRYSNKPASDAPPSEHWVENPYLHEGQAPTYTFNFALALDSAIPIKDVSSPSHRIDVTYDDPAHARVALNPAESGGGNRDFVLRYRLAGAAIESGLLLYKGDTENFFLLMAEPPKRVDAQAIMPREYTFILDVSGSMWGFPLDTAKALIHDLITALRPTDKFNVLLFSGDSALLSPIALDATPANVASALGLISKQPAGGGTELLPALKHAFSLPTTEGYSRAFVVITDGYVDVEPEAFDLIRNSLGAANLFAFGIGSSVNRHLMEGMARAGQGEPFIVSKPEEAPYAARRFKDYIESPLLTKLSLESSGIELYDVDPIAIPDLYAQRPVVLFGKWRGESDGVLSLKGSAADGEYRASFTLSPKNANAKLSALKYLWARSRIATLNDYNNLSSSDDRVKEVTALGLAYNLLTPHTSFIAVDEVVRNTSGSGQQVKQPLPLPQGVADSAVGEQVPSVPEPETYALMAVCLLMMSAALAMNRKGSSRRKGRA
jgi:Ca-activated chloride channel family protein